MEHIHHYDGAEIVAFRLIFPTFARKLQSSNKLDLIPMTPVGLKLLQQPLWRNQFATTYLWQYEPCRGAGHILSHHLWLLTHPICSTFVTHTAMFLCDGNRLHATFAFMLAAYAVSETAIFTAEATWKDAKCLRNQQLHIAAQNCWWKQRCRVSTKPRERKWGNLFGLHLQTSHILLSLLISL